MTNTGEHRDQEGPAARMNAIIARADRYLEYLDGLTYEQYQRDHGLNPARPAQSQADADAELRHLAFDDATRTVTAQYAAGAGLDAIAAHHDDVTADLVSDARTYAGRVYAREYADTARTLIADLRQDQAVAQGRSAAACTQPQGTPHPDPVLAAKGWQVDHGIYQRTAQAQQDREAG